MYLHFTSDLWKCKTTGFHFLALTCHWCDARTFKMRHFCLGTVRVDGKAVNENISILWVNLWRKWEILVLQQNKTDLSLAINKDKAREGYVIYHRLELKGWKRIRSMVCDGGSNLGKAVKRFPELLKQYSQGCVNHIVDNITDSACTEIISVHNTVTNCKECVEYIKRSPPIQEKLYNIQTTMGLAHFKVIQHTPIRWDSKYSMMSRYYYNNNKF